MSEISFKIVVPGDNDGFITLQCPFCEDRFKLTVTDFEREDIIEIFCPYCGLRHEGGKFLTDEVIEQAHIIAANYLKSQVNQWAKDLERSFRSNKHIKFKAGSTQAVAQFLNHPLASFVIAAFEDWQKTKSS